MVLEEKVLLITKDLFIVKYPIIGLLLLTILAYFPTFFNDFQYAWDDQWQVLDYEFVQNHSFHDLAFHFTHFHLGQYMPVNTLEQAIIFPLNLLAIDYILNRFRPAHPKGQIKKVIIEKIPFFAFAALLYAFSISNDLGQLNIEGYPLHQRVMFAMSSFMDYVFRSVAPVKLYYFYFFPIEPGEPLPVYFYGYIVLILIVAAFLWHNHKKNNRLVIFGALLFFINIVLVLHIVPMPRKIITADRYMYLSLVGFGTMFAWFVTYIYTKYRSRRRFFVPAISIWLLSITIHSFVRVQEWKDSGSIKQNVKELIEKRKAEGLPAVDNPLENTPNEKK